MQEMERTKKRNKSRGHDIQLEKTWQHIVGTMKTVYV